MRSEFSSSPKAKRHPYDWCVDESWVARQMFTALGGFAREREEGLAIWDPCIGSGRTMLTFAEHGFDVMGSDIVNRLDPAIFDDDAPMPRFFSADFTEQNAAPKPCSIVCNPPYSYIPNIAEAFVRRALVLSSRRVCMVLPLKWLASQGRYRLFAEEYPPQAVLVQCQRPSMPQGDIIQQLGTRAFGGATVDYGWWIWDVQRPTAVNDTRVIWLPPLNRPDKFVTIEEIA